MAEFVIVFLEAFQVTAIETSEFPGSVGPEHYGSVSVRFTTTF